MSGWSLDCRNEWFPPFGTAPQNRYDVKDLPHVESPLHQFAVDLALQRSSLMLV